jgi:uncharacterized protein (UPF0261 family)
VCAVRTTAAEQAEVGRIFAEKVNAATGRAAVVLPLRGLSAYEECGGPFVDSDADRARFGAVRATLRPWILLYEVEAGINDPAFADVVLEAFDGVWVQ